MIETGKILQGDCIKVMKTLPLTSVDLVVTSPPYNVGIDYDTHHDSMSMEDYWDFTRQWLTEAFHVLKVRSYRGKHSIRSERTGPRWSSIIHV